MDQMQFIPNIYRSHENEDEKEPVKEDINAKLLKTRSVVISNQIDSKMADSVIKQLFILEAEDPDKEILVYINTPGGEIFSGFAIFDVLRLITCPIVTIVAGCSASMGTILMLAADENRRLALPHAKIMIHQPLITKASGQATDLEIRNKELTKTKKLLADIYAKHTGKQAKEILKDMDRDNWFTAEEAVKYGLLDRIITTRAEI